MDERVREHARIIVDHSTDVSAGDEVILSGHPRASDLVTEVARLCGERGANLAIRMNGDRARSAYQRAIDAENVSESAVSLASIEAADVVIRVRADENTFESSDVDPAINAAFARANEAVQDAMLETRWVGTQYPAPGNAQAAEMSTAAYEDFVWGAVNKDWDDVREYQSQLVEILDPADQVHVVSGDETDVTMSIAGNPTQNDFGEKNLPGGEVFTAPIADSVEGTVHFDKPLMAQGREIRDVSLRFEDGEVVEYSAGKNEAVLDSVLDTDPGAKRLGELGIGMNRDIDQFTYNMLFDEKMGDTVHMALGRAYDDTVGDENEGNDSVVHMDMIVDMSEDSFIEVDGERIQEDGTFVFE
ncbi:aminopeptidase [Halovivax limisalsi]|uniref:aminopeptidase n=1 Tax=Halovivax limisalsi TaxID=1453760 RepID=UPI001FFD72C3|nr:aminopeptidase [Halovivax limisalsi]